MQIQTVTIHNFRSIQDARFALQDYSLLIGPNNSGKTNIIDALRVFYEHGYKYDQGRDWPKFVPQDEESWVDVQYVLTPDEAALLKDEYLLPGNELKVRKRLETTEVDDKGKPVLGVYAYTADGSIAPQPFYGAKGVQQGKLGRIIHIPAVSRLDDQTKMTGPSPLRDLVNGIMRGLVGSSTTFQELAEQFGAWAVGLKSEETEDELSLARLEEAVNEDISDWGQTFRLNINVLDEDAIVKNLVSYGIWDDQLNEAVQGDQCGQGFQRHLMFTLIKLAAEFQVERSPAMKQDFRPDMTLLLFEEPEAYLHPPQQTTLRSSLRRIAAAEGHQVLCSSHSPQFVSHETAAISSIVRLHRIGPLTTVGQVSPEECGELFCENQVLNRLLHEIGQGTKDPTGRERDGVTVDGELEAAQYFLWLDPLRCGLFFAKHVLLVEGQADRALLDYLLQEDLINVPGGGLFVLDCIGKFNIHRFMNLVGRLRIPHSVLHDADDGKPSHQAAAQAISESENDYTIGVGQVDPDIEGFLGLTPCANKKLKAQYLLEKAIGGELDPERVGALVALVEGLCTEGPT